MKASFQLARLFLELAEYRGERVHETVDRRRMLFAMKRVMEGE